MLKKQSQISLAFSPINSLKLSSFNYFGMGAVLASVTQSFWINFSAYYLNNILPTHGNLIFLIAQIFQGLGILLGWLILAKFQKPKNPTESNENKKNKICNALTSNCIDGINLYMLIYIIGALMLITNLPLVFLLSFNSVYLIYTFAILAKIGSGLMIISQITIIPKITLNRNRRRKLVQKIVQYGLAGTFFSMFIMTLISTYVNFIWKYFFGVTGFVVLGSICSVVYVYQIRTLVSLNTIQPKQKPKQTSYKSNIVQASPSSIINWQTFKSVRFYIYALILISCTLYMDIIIAIYPYFIKSFHNITHFRYLTAITVLYLSSFICSIVTKNVFVFGSIRIIMTVGFVSSVFATVLLIIGLSENQFDFLMVIGMCLTGISKVIATNCALNLINQLIGKQVKGRQFIYGFYYFLQKVIAGLVLYVIISKVYVAQDVQFLHFSEIYLPFIFYSLAWVLVMIDRALITKSDRSHHIVIIQPQKRNKMAQDELQNQFQHQTQQNQPENQCNIEVLKQSQKFKKFVNRQFDRHTSS